MRCDRAYEERYNGSCAETLIAILRCEQLPRDNGAWQIASESGGCSITGLWNKP